MRWTPGGRSKNLEDFRGSTRGGRGFRVGGAGGMGCGGVLLVLVLSFFFGPEVLTLLDTGGGAPSTSSQPGAPPADTSAEEEKLVDFVSFVLDDAQETWQRLLPNQYRDAKLAVFRGAIDSACGQGQAAMGPFYCPGDEKVYLDLSFFDDLSSRFGAPGDFAQAYVVAHEIGHHVQNVLGLEQQMRQLQRARPSQANELSVRLELQADCFAGVWGHAAEQSGKLEPGEVREALDAASAIGDDRLQEASTGRVVPDSFTHGSSAQRVEWFQRGFESGNPDDCDTFGR
jgi:predicted metalloprotease